MLNPSAITCKFTRSVIGKRRSIRKSNWKNPGRTNAFLCRLPPHPKDGDGTKGAEGKGLLLASRHSVGTMNSLPLMKGDSTGAGSPGGAEVPAGRNEGRFVAVPKSRFGLKPISTLYGRP